MTDHRDTDERLKSRLNADQIGRERMCTAILALDRRYSLVEPRRPEGGPDGARDIQAILADGTQVYGAVGFQNSVTDSKEDKKTTKSKFKSDLLAALGEKQDLKAFVFFTNTDMTPAEQDTLRTEALEKGVTNLDIYWRERIDKCLILRKGLGLRYQYLKIELSAAEQAAFFSSYNTQLEELILKQHERFDEGVRRLEFLHWMARPLRTFQLTVELNRFVTADEVGPYRVLARLFAGGELGIHGWYIGGNDNYLTNLHEGKEVRFFGQTAVYSTGPDPKLKPVLGSSNYMLSARHIIFAVGFTNGMWPTPDEIDGTVVRIYATETIASVVQSIRIDLNGYTLVRMPKVEFGKTNFQIEWPKEFTSGNDPGGWLAGSSGPLMLPHVSLMRTAPHSRHF